MDVDAILRLLRHDNQLKRTARTGWVQRGVVNAESVATHTHGVTFIALVLAQLIDEPVDLGRLLAMATLHDLPESLTTDVPAPAWRFLPAGIKPSVEAQAMDEILPDLPFATQLRDLWDATRGDSIEANLVHDADKLDMYLQAVVYAEQQGNQQLEQFWSKPRTFHFPISQALYERLRAQRPRANAAFAAE